MQNIKYTVLFVPGSGEDINSRDYRSVLNTIESKSYNVEFVPITWSRTTPQKWQNQLMQVYARHDPNMTILAGFSFGAITACMAAAKHCPAQLWLFSLSPYFAENYSSPYMKKSWIRYHGLRRTNEFRKLSFRGLAADIDCPTLLFYGEKEFQKFPIMRVQAELAHETLAQNKLIVIPGVGHDVADRLYVKAICENLTTKQCHE